jgi:acetoin utilization deacetylase AcuC-like enzyme
MSIAFHDTYVHPLPENHKFPMDKYELLHMQLLYEGIADKGDFFQPSLIETKDVYKIHTKEYIEKLFDLKLTPREQRVSGFQHTLELIERERRIMGGTKECASSVLNGGIALNIAGGTHHAYTNRAEGFCLLNDQAIAAQWLLDETHIDSVLIVDLDVHQGNGTAEIFANNDRVYTFSMHGKGNYPLKKELSDLDISLEDGTDDKQYLQVLENSLDQIVSEFTPEFIFFQCGVDVLATDKLGRLSLSRNGCKERDRIVLGRAKELNLPIVCTMGGGYSEKIKDIVEAHANTFRLAKEIF